MMKKKIGVLLIGMAMLTASLTACGQKAADPAPQGEPAAAENAPAADTTDTTDTADNTDNTAAEESTADGVVSTETATLKLYGPGLFTTVGADGTTDLVTGLTKPGYQVILDRWKELYPNVDVQIEAIPWDNWKAAVQTAALSGDYDILIHGNGNADFCLDMTEYIAGDEEIQQNIPFFPLRRNPEDMTELKAYGFSYNLNPAICVLDKQILENYGVAIPDASWTYDDLLEIARQCTGTDPVSGKQTYGISMYKASDAYKNYKVVSMGMDDVIFEFAPAIADTKVNFNNDKTVKVFDYIAELGRLSSPDYLEGLNLGNAYKEESDTAMIWADDIFNVYNTIVANGVEERFMFLPLPKVAEGAHKGITSSNLADLNISIYKETEQKDLAWAFLRFLVTDPVVQQWYIDTYSIPANSKYSELLYDVMPSQYADAIAEVVSTSPEGFDSSASVWYDSTWFGTLQSDIGVELDQVIRSQETAADAVKKIQSNIESYLASVK